MQLYHQDNPCVMCQLHKLLHLLGGMVSTFLLFGIKQSVVVHQTEQSLIPAQGPSFGCLIKSQATFGTRIPKSKKLSQSHKG